MPGEERESSLRSSRSAAGSNQVKPLHDLFERDRFGFTGPKVLPPFLGKVGILKVLQVVFEDLPDVKTFGPVGLGGQPVQSFGHLVGYPDIGGFHWTSTFVVNVFQMSQ
jgi:hypothetical protein